MTKNLPARLPPAIAAHVVASAGALIAGALVAAPATAAVRAEIGRMPPPPPGASTAAGYVILVNDDARPRVLIGVQSPIAERVGVHDMSMDGGIMRMRTSGPLVIAPHGRLALDPGAGRHLMFTGLRAHPKLGELVSVTFVFDHGQPLRAALKVETAAQRP